MKQKYYKNRNFKSNYLEKIKDIIICPIAVDTLCE